MAFPLRKPGIGNTGWGANVNQNWSDIEQMLTGLQNVSGLVMSGALDFNMQEIERLEDMQITGDWLQLKATLDGRYYTQEQVLDLIQGATFEYWLTDTADPIIGGYLEMVPASTGEAQSQVGPTVIDADPKLLATFITESSQPNFTVLTEGVYTLNIHANASVGANIKAAALHWALYRRAVAGGVETLIATSETGEEVINANAHYDVHLVVTEEVQLDPTDRLVMKVYGNRIGTQPQNPSMIIYFEGTTSSRMGVRTSLSAFDSRYVLLNGENTMLAALAMGGFAITNPGLVDGVDIAALKTDVDEFPDELKNLLAAEINQLTNIGASTISAAQWAYLGSLVSLLNLTDVEAFQLTNIGTVTISNTQWGRLGDLVGPPGMVDRGDAAGFDYTVGDFTTNGAWHDLDLSGIVPAGAKTVALSVGINDNLVGQAIFLRTKGNGNIFNVSRFETQVSGLNYFQDVFVPCDSNREIQYLLENTVWTAVWMTVKGWWF